jgi:hypothetical protein
MAYCPNYPSKEYLDRCILLSDEECLVPTDEILLKYGKKKYETFDEMGRPMTGWTVAIFEDGKKRIAPGVYDPEMFVTWFK